MKHKTASSCVLALVVGLLLFAGAGLSLAASPPKATGGVTFTTVEDSVEIQRRIEFNAHEGDPDWGNLNYRDTNGDWFRVDIDCVTVLGDSGLAFFSGPIVSASDSTMVGQWLMVKVYDGGSPGRKGDQVWGGMYSTDPECKPGIYPPLDGPWDVENGNLVVH
jgi:hypothetical protein